MHRLALFLAALAFAGTASAQDLRLTDTWVRWIPGGAPSGGYFTVHNDSAQPVDLVGASCVSLDVEVQDEAVVCAHGHGLRLAGHASPQRTFVL